MMGHLTGNGYNLVFHGNSMFLVFKFAVLLLLYYVV